MDGNSCYAWKGLEMARKGMKWLKSAGNGFNC